MVNLYNLGMLLSLNLHIYFIKVYINLNNNFKITLIKEYSCKKKLDNSKIYHKI